MSKRTMTVASIQTSYGHDLAGQHRQDGRLRSRSRQAWRASRSAVGAVPGHLLLHATGSEMVRNRVCGDRTSVRARTQKAGGEARCRHPDLVLREGRPALLQQHRDCRRGRRNPRRLSQEPHSGWPRLSGEILLPAGRHRLQDLDDEARPHRRRHLLGPVVSGMRTRDGPAGRRGIVLSDGHRIGAL